MHLYNQLCRCSYSKEIFGLGAYVDLGATIIIISNEEMNDILKTAKSLEDSNIFNKSITITIENETKKERGGFLGMLLHSLSATLLRNILDKLTGVIRACWQKN